MACSQQLAAVATIIYTYPSGQPAFIYLLTFLPSLPLLYTVHLNLQFTTITTRQNKTPVPTLIGNHKKLLF